jgi:hypothetical protein
MEKRIYTRRKAAIRDAFLEVDRPLSPDQVLEGAQRHHPSLGKATVYRNIQSLVNEGWLQSVEIPGDSPRMKWPGKRITVTSSAINTKSSMSWRDTSLHSNRSCRVAFGQPTMSSSSTGFALSATTEIFIAIPESTNQTSITWRQATPLTESPFLLTLRLEYWIMGRE